ncbi:unnamed protein product [Camellia sinensis]
MMKMGLLGAGLAGSAGLDLQHRDINNLLPRWYVDTFNKGARNQTNLFQSPSVPSIKPASADYFCVGYCEYLFLCTKNICFLYGIHLFFYNPLFWKSSIFVCNI